MYLKQGTRVEFNVQTLKGKGTVVGLASNGQPVIGESYIIEPDEKLDSEICPYTHFTAWMCDLKLI